MKIVVTGSEGFIGKNLCPKLTSNGHEIIRFDNKLGHDITETSLFNENYESGIIIHLAAKSFVPDSYINPIDLYKTNITGTLNVLEYARKNKSKVIFFSSYIYGTPNQLPVKETHSKNPHNPYAQSKSIGEELCFAYYRDFGVPSIIFRPFNIYGNGQRDSFLIPSIMKQIKTGVVNLANASPKRDYIYKDDIVDAVITAVDSDFNACEAYNLGTGVSISVDELTKIISKHCKYNFKVSYKNEIRQNEVDDCFADISKIKKQLNWFPKVGITEGIVKLLKEYNYDK